MNNTKICNLFKTNEFTIELHVDNKANEMRLYIMDSDNQYVDDWAFDIGENIEDMIALIASKVNDGYESFVEVIKDAFNKDVYYGISIQQYHEMVIEYGREFVNRIGGCVLITKS